MKKAQKPTKEQLMIKYPIPLIAAVFFALTSASPAQAETATPTSATISSALTDTSSAATANAASTTEDDSLSPLPGSMTVPAPEFIETPGPSPQIGAAMTIVAQPQLAATGAIKTLLLGYLGMCLVGLGWLFVAASRFITKETDAAQ